MTARDQISKWRTRMVALAMGCHSLAAMAIPSVVQTDAGALSGIARSDGGVTFMGVPFAAPPVGDLRWKAPAPVAPWTATRDATQAQAGCPQAGAVPVGVPRFSEDCLYLNVYVPPGASPSSRLPVMVWIHGGGFVNGAATQYDATELAKNAQAVVVTINYRLGIFGFLAQEALLKENKAGNYGLQDQQAALRWVKRNIAGFGGDVSRVTIFGESAGGMAVCHQLVSPPAAGLFHRAIVMSGPCVGGSKLETALAAGKALADRLGCAAGDQQAACIRSKSTAEVEQATGTADPSNPLGGITLAGPFLDGVILPAQPKALIRDDKFHKVPVMIGATKDEGTILVALAYDLSRGTPMTEDEYKGIFKSLTGSDLAASVVTSLYSPAKYGSANLAAANLLGDAAFACGTQEVARLLSSRTPTYAYEFQERGVPKFAEDPYMEWGAYHGSELPLLLQTAIGSLPPRQDPAQVHTPEQMRLGVQMAKYWGRFAATGNPNVPGQVKWPRFDRVITATQQLVTPAVSTNYLNGISKAHNCYIWDSLSALGLGL